MFSGDLFADYRHHVAYVCSALLIAMSCIATCAIADTAPTFADPAKVLRVVLPAAETGFDPVATQDLYSAWIQNVLFDTLYDYDYLARPVKVVPRAAVALPEVTDNGKTYTIHLKPGIYFIPDPAFGNKKRELTMADFVYSFKRLVDPRMHSPNSWMFDGKIVGLDQLVADAKKTGKFNYDQPIAGFEIVDPYTLKIHLTHPDYDFAMILAHTPAAAVAREVVEKYQDMQGWVMAHPVGTGPYQLTSWTPGSLTVVTANQGYRKELWNFQPGPDPEDKAIVAQMQGKRIPQIGRIEFQDIGESQSSWLAFQKKEVDLIELGSSLVPKVIAAGKLKPEFAQQGIHLSRYTIPGTYFSYWNMQDPLLGGLSKEKIALRRAIAMAYDPREEIAVVLRGDALPIDYPIPPGVVGADPNYKSSLQYDPEAANALLDRFGYKQGADGWRTQPNGLPLVLHYTVQTSGGGGHGQTEGELWKKIYDSIHIHVTIDSRIFADLLKAEVNCQIQSRSNAWIADYPDGDDFMLLYYGPNIHGANNSCVSIPEYDALYRQTQQMPAGPARDVLYHKMTRILEVNGVIRMGFVTYGNYLSSARVIGFKKHPIIEGEWAYLDIDQSK